MNPVPEVTTGDKVKGKLKEGLGTVLHNKDMKEEGKAVKKVEKDTHKVEKQNEKILKQQVKMDEHAMQGGVQVCLLSS